LITPPRPAGKPLRQSAPSQVLEAGAIPLPRLSRDRMMHVLMPDDLNIFAISE
jgi:hypothetical protein